MNSELFEGRWSKRIFYASHGKYSGTAYLTLTLHEVRSPVQIPYNFPISLESKAAVSTMLPLIPQDEMAI